MSAKRGQKYTVPTPPICSQAEFEADVRDVVKHGDVKAISELTGRGYSLLAQQFNSDDDRPSDLFKAIQIIMALYVIDRQRGDELMEVLVRYVNRVRGTDIAKDAAEYYEQMSAKVAFAKMASKEVQ